MIYNVLQGIPFPVLVLTGDGNQLKPVFQNLSFEKHFVCERQPLINWEDLIGKFGGEKIAAGFPISRLVYDHAGSTLPVEINPGMLRKPDKYWYNLHIEHMQQTEEAWLLTFEPLSLQTNYTQKVVDRMLDLAVILDEDRNILYANSPAKTSYGYEPTDLVGVNILTLIPPEDLEYTLQASAKLRKERKLQHFNTRVRHAEGHYVPVSLSIHWDFKLKQSTCIIRDVSEVTQLQSDYNRLNSEYVDLMELCPLPLWIYEVDTLKIIKVNTAALNHYGYSREEFLSFTLLNLRPESEYENLIQAIEKVKETSTGASAGQYRHKIKSGKEIVVEISGSITYLGGKKCEIIIANDVTNLLMSNKRLEEKSIYLAAINELCLNMLTGSSWLQSLTDSFPALARSLNADRAYYFEFHQDDTNQEWLISQKTAWSSALVTVQHDNPDLQNIPSELVDEFIQEIKKNGFYSAITPLTKQNLLRELLESQQILSLCIIPVYDSGKLKGMIGFDDCHNYRPWREAELSYLQTIRNIAEQALLNEITLFKVHDLDFRLNSLINNLPGITYRCKGDDKYTTIFISEQFEVITGYSTADLVGGKIYFTDIIHPDDLAHTFEYLQLADEEGVFELEYRIITASGHIIYVQEKGTVFYDKQGRPDYLEGLIFDITDAHRHREEIDKNLDRLQLIFRASNEAMCDWDIQNDHCVWGDGFREVFGYNLDTYDNYLWSNNIYPEDRNSVLEMLDKVMKDPGQDIFYMEYRFLYANRKIAYIQHRGIFQRNADGKPIRAVGSFRDITDIRDSQQKIMLKNNQLREIAWMQSHKLRAPVARILALLQLLELEGRLPEVVQEEFKLILNSAAELDMLIKSVVNKTGSVPVV